MSTEITELYYSLDTIEDAAEKFWKAVSGYNLFTFSGEMGAGKTTFIHKLCDYLEVQDTVSSPTFALINEYHFTDKGRDRTIHHLDWYRLKDTEEAISAGMEDCIDQARKGDTICFIEWPEKAIELLSPPFVRVRIETLDMHERKMTLEAVKSL